MPKIPSAEQVQVNFRLPAELRDMIKDAAGSNNRSMNAEIVSRLGSSFAQEAPFIPDEIQLDEEEEVKMEAIMQSFAEMLKNRRQLVERDRKED